MSDSNVTNIRCMFAVPGTDTYQGFNTVARWGWAKSEVDLSKEKKRVKKDLKEMERRFNEEVRFDQKYFLPSS